MSQPVRDPADEPETDGMSLVLPFVVCQSKGGPYDDTAFVAGYQTGQIDARLEMAAAAGAVAVCTTVMTALVRQLELVAMNRGFPVMHVQTSDDSPEWSMITFMQETI